MQQMSSEKGCCHSEPGEARRGTCCSAPEQPKQKLVHRRPTRRPAAPDPRPRAPRSRAALRRRRLQSQRRPLDRRQRRRHRLALDHLADPLLLAAGHRRHRTRPSLSRRRRRLPLGQRSLRRLPRIPLRLVLLDQQHALRADGHALFRRRLGLRARPRPSARFPTTRSSRRAFPSHCSRSSRSSTSLASASASGSTTSARSEPSSPPPCWSVWVLSSGRASARGITAADFKIPANPRFVLNSFGVICFGLVGLELASVMGDEIQDPAPHAARRRRLGRRALRRSLYRRDAHAADRRRQRRQRAARRGAGRHVEWRPASAWAGLPFPSRSCSALAIAGIGSAWIGGSARIPFVAGLDSYMPSWLGKVHPRYATPYAALIVQGIVSAVLVILNFAGAGVQETFQKLLSLAVVLQLVPFVYMFGALVKFAVTESEPKASTAGPHCFSRDQADS